MRTDVGPLEICVDRDGSTVYIEGHYQATSDAVAWYRSVVPASENILLTNEAGSYVWSVRADVTADDVRAFMKSGDPVHLEPRYQWKLHLVVVDRGRLVMRADTCVDSVLIGPECQLVVEARSRSSRSNLPASRDSSRPVRTGRRPRGSAGSAEGRRRATGDGGPDWTPRVPRHVLRSARRNGG
jgi:hypothetical protein